MNKKGMIVAFSICIAIVAGLIATIIVLASGTQGVGTSVSVLYVATDIEGTVSAKYSKVNKNTSAVISTTDMVTSSGSKTVSFLSTAPTTTSLLNPTESTIALTAEQDLIVTYTFTAVATYYATLEYKDSSISASNIEFSYALNDETFKPEMSMPIEVTPDKSTTYSIKLHIANTARNANLSGSLNWALTKEKPDLPLRDSNLSIYFVNNDNSAITQNNVAIQKNSDGTKFKIVGPTPIIDSSSTTSYLNGSFNDRTTTATGKVSSIGDLTNSSGAEFYYFCTNSAIVGSLSYNDPGEVYYTSTADSTLESWYDLPTSNTNLYACFMTPNYSGGSSYSSSDPKVVISNTVETIPYLSFDGKTSITSVTIPQSVKNIGYGTKKIGDYGVFRYCNGLTKLHFPNSLINIGQFAFYECDNLSSIVIPSSVRLIEGGSFSCCDGIASITVLQNNANYYSSNNCLIEKSEKILVLACNDSIMPSDIKSIGVYAFDCCTTTSISISEGVTSIGENAFSGCSELTSLSIPNSIVSIGNDAFSGCRNLSYNTKDGLNYLGNTANPYVVVHSVADNSKTTYSIDSGARIIYNECFYNCNNLSNIIIPNNVKQIGESAFSRCTALTNLTLGSSIVSIEMSAFGGCIGLTSLIVPDSVKSIGASAFDSCYGLESVVIGSGIQYIGARAFNIDSERLQITTFSFKDTSGTWTLKRGTTVKTGVSVANSSNNIINITNSYTTYEWFKDN